MNMPQIAQQAPSSFEEGAKGQIEAAIKAAKARLSELNEEREIVTASINQNIGMRSLFDQFKALGVTLALPAQQGEADVLPFQQSTEQIMNGAVNEASGS